MDDNQNLSIEDLLKKYVNNEDPKGGDPASTPPSSPVVLPGLTGNITANSMEEAQAILRTQMEQARGALMAANAQIQELQERSKPTPTETTENLNLGAPTGGTAPLEFLEQLVGNPADVIGKEVLKNSEIKNLLGQVKALNMQVARSEFGKRHPLYDRPEVYKMLDTVREKSGMDATPENYEMIASHLVMNNVLPHENVIREHQRRLFLEELQRQNQSQSGQTFAQGGAPQQMSLPYGTAVPQHFAPAPPPSTASIPGSGGIPESSVNALAGVAPNMSVDDLKRALEEIDRKGIR